MEFKTSVKFMTVYELPKLRFTILANQQANLFWQVGQSRILPLSELPWKYQLPFYLKFLHDDRLAERFKDLEIIGAIDIYVKSRHFLNQELGFDY